MNGNEKAKHMAIIERARENGSRVEAIFREAEAVEGEIKRLFKRFTQRLERCRDGLTRRTRTPKIADGASMEVDTEDAESSD